ncbi:unnamed protein product [Parnassius mnemosyne]|uniref:Uncharacterized protein n=1 Tax=Parnassius mnemosyne TaxID=213953 RepID=A0AAV1LGF5_9NEOP
MMTVKVFALFLTIFALVSLAECHWIGGWGRPPVVVVGGGFGFGYGGGFYRPLPHPPPPPPFFYYPRYR